MDKSQKQLVDTYFRKRRIAAKESRHHNLHDYEMINHSVIKNGFLKPDDLSDGDVRLIMAEFPDLTDIFTERIKNFTDDDLASLFQLTLKDREKYIDMFKNRFPYFNMHKVYRIISSEPSMVKYFLDKLPLFDGRFISVTLRFQPSLAPYFKKYAHKMSDEDIAELLYNEPQFIDLYDVDFEKTEMARNGYSLKKWLTHHPEYANHPKVIPYVKKHEDILKNG